MRDKIASMVTEQNARTPVFQAHGQVDMIVRFDWGRLSRDILKEKLGHEVEWHEYPGLDHSADPQEINHLEEWLQRRIG